MKPFCVEADWDLPNTFPRNPAADVGQVHAYIAFLRRQYNAGQLMYPRNSLRLLSAQIKAGAKVITTVGWDGCPATYTYPSGLPPSSQWLPCIAYDALEHIFHSLYNIGDIVSAVPFSVAWMPPPTPMPPLSADKAMTTSRMYEERWCRGDAHKLLVASLAPLALTKIVGIAAGSLLREGEWADAAFFQHAAIHAIAQALHLKAYCQDPAYAGTEKELLAQLDITILQDPDAFLEVDSSSVVMSICPGVPAKQIIADDQTYWPAAMIWNPIQSVEEEKALFRPDLDPFMDPTGDRVRAMVKHYTRIPLSVDPVFSHRDPVELYILRESKMETYC